MPRPNADNSIQDEDLIRFGEDIEVFPMGLDDDSEWARKVFRMPPDPSIFNEEDLRRVSALVWREKPSQYFNFENPDHIISLYSIVEELQTEGAEDPNQIYGAAASLVRTLKYYESQAKLNDLQREVLQMKLQNIQNVKIMQYINEKYGTTYNDNYISTIYRQKVIPEITKAATEHRLIMENIFYPEMFKKCKDCGRLTLRDPWFFMRQHKNADGFSPRCKACERLKREKIKEKRKNEQQSKIHD